MTKTTTLLLWALAFVITIAAAIYQKTTGPTYPVKGNVAINGNDYDYKLLRSHGGDDDASIKFEFPKNVSGKLLYRPFRSNDDFVETNMKFVDNELIGKLPHQPPAGKLEYKVLVNDGDNEFYLSEQPTVIRFKGEVPLGILIPHIFFMFTAMFVSTRTGIEAIAKGTNVKKLTIITLVSLFIGGLILGPIVQKYAFGDYWTGWPFGGDWTDNKTIFAWGFWFIAFMVLRKKPQNRLWPIIAMLVLFAVYMIPHSMGGSELDTKTGKVTTGLKK